MTLTKKWEKFEEVIKKRMTAERNGEQEEKGQGKCHCKLHMTIYKTHLSSKRIMFSSDKPPYTRNFLMLQTCVFSYLPNLMVLSIAGLSSFRMRYCNTKYLVTTVHINYYLNSQTRQKMQENKTIFFTLWNYDKEVLVQIWYTPSINKPWKKKITHYIFGERKRKKLI